MIRLRTLHLVAGVVLAGAPALAQIPATDFAARRDSLAVRIDSGVVVAFGGRTLVNDFGTFFQLPAFHYLTNFDEPDAAFVMVVRDRHGAGTFVSVPDQRPHGILLRAANRLSVVAAPVRDFRAAIRRAPCHARLPRRDGSAVLHPR